MQEKKLERKKLIEEINRKDILDSAATVLLEKGRKGFTMQRVASIAGFAKGTVYLYFKDKKELLYSIMHNCFEPLERELEAIIASDHDPVRKLEQCVLASLKHAEENKPLLRALGNLLFNTMYRDIGNKKSWYWHDISLFTTALEEGVKAGKLRAMNTEKMAALFLGCICGLRIHRIHSPETDTMEEDVRELMGLFINGLAL